MEVNATRESGRLEELMIIFLAAKYSRREELCKYKEELQAKGHKVQASWLDGKNQKGPDGFPLGEEGELLIEKENQDKTLTPRAIALRQKMAHDGFRDVLMCDLFIGFTETPRINSRGGRYVEMGIALGRMRMVWIVGPRENLFCWHEDIKQFDTWEQCLAMFK